MLSIYPACFFKEETGYTVVFPDLENGHLATCGENLEDAMSMAIDCLAGYLYDCKRDGDIIPPASDLTDIDLSVIWQNTYDCEADYNNSFVTMVSVDVASYAKKHFEKPVKKTLTSPFWLNQAALEKNINFSQVLQEALLQKIKSM